jgi:hypothetical protein
VHRFVTCNDGTGFIKFPELTTIQRDALPATIGYTIYNTDDGELQSYQAGSWQTVIGSSLTVTETDLGPNVANVTEIRFPTGSVTDLGSGIVTVTGFLSDSEGVSHGDVIYFDGSSWTRIAPGTSGQVFQTNGIGAAPTWTTLPGGGNVIAALSLTDNAIVRGDGGSTGVQTSAVLIDDSDNVTGIVNITTTGTVTFNGVTYTYPGADAAGALTSDGAGNLSWAAVASSLEVEDEGVSLSTAVTKIDFAGAGVTATEPVANEILVTIPGGGGGSGETVEKDINQTTHGFSVGEWVYHNGTIYVLAQADVDATSDAVGVVSAVAGVDDFTLVVHGYVSGLSGLTAGAAHFISDTVAGAITATPPADVGEIVKPVIVADSTTSGYVNILRGNEVTGSPAGIVVEDEGSTLTSAVDSFDFVGAGVTATNVGDAVTVTIPGGGGGATLDHDVNQTTHGFSVNDWVYHNGTIYALADASAAGTAESIGIVSAVAGVDDFTVQFGGRITGLTGLTAGEAHFLSETAGLITATAPTTSGAISKPVLVADSTTSGFIFNMRGAANTDSAAFNGSFVDGDLTAGVLTVAHNLGRQYVQVQVFDDSDQLIQPDDITLTDGNNLDIDLTSFGTLTGTYNYVIHDSGTTVNLDIPTYTQTFVDGDLTAGVIAISHNLDDQYPLVQVYDNSNNVVIPDEITATSTSVTTLDLSGFGTLVGTYRVVISATGGTAAASPTNTSFAQSFVDGDLTASVLTVTHNLGVQYNQVMVYNNNGDIAVPDDITATSTNVTTLDFTSFGTLTGTWNVIILSAGAVQSSTATDLNLTGQAAEDFAVFDGTNWLARGGTELVRSDSFTRDTATASGFQGVTGVGFRPKFVKFFGTQGGTSKACWGADDGSRPRVVADNHGDTADTYAELDTDSLYFVQTSTAQYFGHIDSFDADGFTIDWTRSGTPTGTVNIKFVAFR